MAHGVPLRRVRQFLVAGVVLLLVLLAGLIGYARWRVHGLMKALPGRLGVHITQESDNVTYTQSYRGRTIYTIHAAKQIQKQAGKYTLHDVGMVLYGAKGDRADRIHGSEFEYDQANGIMTAVGEVFLDLGAPNGGKTPATGSAAEGKIIHVRTSGLSFLEKQRTAATDAEVDFSTGEMTGRALGATYDAASGLVVLRSDVHMSGLHAMHAADAASARPIAITAARAEMERIPASTAEAKGAAAIGLAAAGNGNLVKLDQARVVSATAHGEQTMAAQHAVVRLAEDGSPRRIDGEGQVTLTQDGPAGNTARITSQRIAVDLNPAGQPTAAQLTGEVRLQNEGKNRVAQGAAREARVDFDSQGRPTRALLTGAVTFDQHEDPATTRHLQAEKVDLALAGGGKQKVVVRQAIAGGPDGAQLRASTPGSKGTGLTETTLRADTLTARFAPARGKTELTALDGQGATRLEQTARNAIGIVQSRDISTGEALTASFHDVDGRQELDRAEQRGRVTVETASLRKPEDPHTAQAKPELQLTHARGQLAVYERAADTLTLTGGVQLADPDSSLFAERVQMQRATGDSTAEGGVRVTYAPTARPSGAASPASTIQEPVHIIAARAVSHKTTGITDFFAAPGARVRMWQGGSQVEAPVVTLDRIHRTMLAHDDLNHLQSPPDTVRAVLLNQPRPRQPSDPPRPGVSGNNGPVRIASREMRYLDVTRIVELHGGVRVEQDGASLRSQDATIFLAPAASPGAASPTKTPSATADIVPAGRVDRIVGIGAVQLDQPGRKATGDRLVYTAADETFVLTGTRAVPPVLVDDQRGTVTGAALKFRKGDETVVVTGTEENGASRRVTTETKSRQ